MNAMTVAAARCTALAACVLAAPAALSLSAHNCQVIYRSLPVADGTTYVPANQYDMLKSLLTGLYLEKGQEVLIKGGAKDRYYYSSDLMARALKVKQSQQKSALIYSLKELEQISPGAYPGVHFIYAGSYSKIADGDIRQKFNYLSQRFAQNGWTLSFLLGKSWENQLRSGKVMLLRRIAKITGGRGLTFFKKDVASCLVSLRPNPAFEQVDKVRRRSHQLSPSAEMSERLRQALDDPDFRTL